MRAPATGSPGSPAAPTVAVVLVAATPARLRALRGLLEGPGFVVVCDADSPDAAAVAVDRRRPDAVLLDLALPDGGLETIERVMATHPTPIVVCGPAAESAEAALAAGAVDSCGALDAPPGSPQYALALRRHLALASRIRVITHPRGRLLARGLSAGPAADERRGSRPPDVGPTASPSGVAPVPAPVTRGPVRLVAVGASTGGPPALAAILGELPRDLDVPIVVVQHMAAGFVEGLAAWLDSLSRLPVRVATEGLRLQPGTVVLAPADANLTLGAGLVVRLSPRRTGQFHLPGIDETFTSVAHVLGPRAVGVLLTGMGRDGAMGLRRMREAGAFTIGQDEATSVVFGMPSAAQALDAVDDVLGLTDMAAGIVAAVNRPPWQVERAMPVLTPLERSSGPPRRIAPSAPYRETS